MRKIILILLIAVSQMTVCAKEEPEQLYAQSAVLMDAESGRVLFEKDGYKELPMASTTKIMTCIIALEHGNLDDVVTFSENAAKQPKVHLGARAGTKIVLRDLLYSLMLESHNDSAVAIAEHIGGSVEGFAEMMNQKAKALGCEHTHYITPNGLDAADEGGNHDTTAVELANIMSYCILRSEEKEEFLKITQTSSYVFSDIDGKQRFHCTNHNRFLSMMEGAISGKTGYTSKAGYCYVGALERDGRTFVVSLLACGWPNHKNYKWTDTRKLMEYGLGNYEYQNVYEEQKLPNLTVVDGIAESDQLSEDASVELEVKADDKILDLLKREDEQVKIDIELPHKLQAPIDKGEAVGKITYYLEGNPMKEYVVVTGRDVAKKNMGWYFGKVIEKYFKI